MSSCHEQLIVDACIGPRHRIKFTGGKRKKKSVHKPSLKTISDGSINLFIWKQDIRM